MHSLGVSHHGCTHPHHLLLSEQIQRLHMFVHTLRLGHCWSALFGTGTHVECSLIREDAHCALQLHELTCVYSICPSWWDQVSHRRWRVAECAYKKGRITGSIMRAKWGDWRSTLTKHLRSPLLYKFVQTLLISEYQLLPVLCWILEAISILEQKGCSLWDYVHCWCISCVCAGKQSRRLTARKKYKIERKVHQC